MKITDIFKRSAKNNGAIGILLDNNYDICVSGYTSLADNPEIVTACKKIAELIGSMTIYLMSNTNNGDIRIVNELSRLIDIEPNKNMTRKVWMESIVMNLLLYGKGNSIVLPHTYDGYIQSLEPIAPSRVNLLPKGLRDYDVLIDGKPKSANKVLHFVHNPDRTYLWRGRGLDILLKDLANNVKQARETEKGFMESKWKPSIIVKVDGLTEEFGTKAGRLKLLEDYAETGGAGKPWVIPAEQMDIEQVRPLSLADLAINDTVNIDKRTIASIVGVPPFVLGVGEYDRNAWNSFIQNTIRPIVLGMQQELTKKLIINPKWYIKFNTLSLMDWDLQTLANVFGGLADKGIITGNEVRDRLGYPPIDGLDELRILENYIPVDKIGEQKKLISD